MNLISSHLTRLFDFSGRENRQPFWLWVLVTYGVQMVLTFALMIPMMIGMIDRMQGLQRYDQAYLNAHPEIAPQVMLTAMLPFFRTFFLLMAAVVLVMALLLAAAVTRRLHDTGRSGYWALPWAILQIATLAGYALLFPRFFAVAGSLGPNPTPEASNAAFAAVMPLFAGVWVANMAGFVFMVVLIVFLAQRGTIGPNRYGDDLLPPPYPYPQPWQQNAPPPYPGPWSDPPLR